MAKSTIDQRIEALEHRIEYLQWTVFQCEGGLMSMKTYFELEGMEPSIADWLAENFNPNGEDSSEEEPTAPPLEEIPDLNVLPPSAGNCGVGEAQ